VDFRPLLAVVGNQPRRTHRLKQGAILQTMDRQVLQGGQPGQAAAFDRDGVSAVDQAAQAVHRDEARAVDAQGCGKAGIFDRLDAQDAGRDIRADVRQRAGPADRIVNGLPLEGYEGADTHAGDDQAFARQLLQALAHRGAADRKASDQLLLALQALAVGESARADLRFQRGGNPLRLRRGNGRLCEIRFLARHGQSNSILVYTCLFLGRGSRLSRRCFWRVTGHC